MQSARIAAEYLTFSCMILAVSDASDSSIRVPRRGNLDRITIWRHRRSPQCRCRAESRAGIDSSRMFLSLLLAATVLQDSTPVYSGRASRTHVDVPRIDTVASIDGVLDEPVWRRAARLTGFSQYQPVDGRPAD